MLVENNDLIARVRRALASDADVGPDADHITVTPGDPWRIGGEVGSVAARRKAARVAARALPGVCFADEVRLERRIRCSDEGLLQAIWAAIEAEPAFAGIPLIQPGARPPAANRPWIGVMAHGGVIYLGGRLDAAERSLAEGLAWETAACSDVVNLISRESGGSGSDAAAEEAVQILVERHPALLGRRLEVGATHGVIRLRGKVGDDKERTLALGLCWLIPEVQEVHDLLQLEEGTAAADQPSQPEKQ